MLSLNKNNRIKIRQADKKK